VVICVVGDLEDLSAAYVGWLAEQRGITVLRLREERLGLTWAYALDDRGGAIDADGVAYDVRDIAGAFVRFNPDAAVAPELGVPEEASDVYALERRHGLHWLLDEAPFTVINRPSSGRSNGSKPFQMLLLAAAGLRVPRWTVTNDASVATEFLASCPSGTVYKACSGLRSHVRRADAALLERIAAGTAPVLLQEYVPGKDVRIHVLRTATFATAVVSDAVDYRFESESSAYAPAEVPDDIAIAAREVTAQDGLTLSGLDFRVDPEGRWWCLEMNPVPTFLPYEAGSGHAIGDAIVDALTGGDIGRPRRSRLAVASRP
jgi:hypothetical protein